MRIINYEDGACENSMASVTIRFREDEINVLDNALYEASKTDEHKNDISFLEAYNTFHLFREFINHGTLLKDDVEYANNRIQKIKELKDKAEHEKRGSRKGS